MEFRVASLRIKILSANEMDVSSTAHGDYVQTYYGIEAFCEQNTMNPSICFSFSNQNFGEACFLICLPIWILVPNRRGKTFGVIINILLKTNNKEQYVSITQEILTSARIDVPSLLQLLKQTPSENFEYSLFNVSVKGKLKATAVSSVE